MQPHQRKRINDFQALRRRRRARGTCARRLPRVDVHAALFGTISAAFTELAASSKDSSAACTCPRARGAPIYACPFSRLDSECHERTIRVGAHQGCRVNTEGLWGIWRALRPRAADRQAGLCLTRRFNCLCFFHYFYCLFSASRAPWPCGKVTMAAAAAACSHNWALCRAGNGRWRRSQ